MKLVLISDTHGEHPDIPCGDVLIHAGDLTHLGSFAELKSEVAWLKSLPHTRKLLVPGNHDVCCENIIANKKEPELVQFLRQQGVVYLRDEAVVLNGIKFWGTPWVPQESGGVFLGSGPELRSHFSRIPADVDVLVTHCPPFGILDAEYGEHLGSPELSEVLRRSSPRVHCFGHIHSATGRCVVNGTTYVNAADHPEVAEVPSKSAEHLVAKSTG